MNKPWSLLIIFCVFIFSTNAPKQSLAFNIDDSLAIDASLKQCNAETTLAALTIEGCYDGLQMVTANLPQRNRNFRDTQSCVNALSRLNLSQLAEQQFKRCDQKWTHIYFRQGCKEATTTYFNNFDIATFCAATTTERKTVPVFQRSAVQNRHSSLTPEQQNALNNALTNLKTTPVINNPPTKRTIKTQAPQKTPIATQINVQKVKNDPKPALESKKIENKASVVSTKITPTKPETTKAQPIDKTDKKTTKLDNKPALNKVDKTKKDEKTTPPKTISPKEMYITSPTAVKIPPTTDNNQAPTKLNPATPLAFQIPKEQAPDEAAFSSATNVGLTNSDAHTKSLIVPFKQTPPATLKNETPSKETNSTQKAVSLPPVPITGQNKQTATIFNDAIPQNIGGMPTTGGIQEAKVENKNASPFVSSSVSTQNPTSLKDMPLPVENQNIQWLNKEGNSVGFSTIETPKISNTNSTQKTASEFPTTGLNLPKLPNTAQDQSAKSQAVAPNNATSQVGLPGFFSTIDQTQVLTPSETPKTNENPLTPTTNSTLTINTPTPPTDTQPEKPQSLTENAPKPPSSDDQNYNPDPR